MTNTNRPKSVLIAAVFACVFGALTVFSGGSVLFDIGPARAAAGNYIPFIAWFNFLAGWFYILAGIGLYLWQGWAVKLSMFIFMATLAAFAVLSIHIAFDGLYEMRTIGAMALRSTVWLIIAFMSRAAWNKVAGQ